MEETKKYRIKGEPISLDEMKQFLWGAATRLRGQIDAAGYKEYIFPLLFFKRISDVYDEQYGEFVCEGGEDFARAQSEDFVIRIPDGAHWSDVREVTENVGQRLVEAFIAIEQANPGKEMDGRVIGGLEGIFGPKDGWTNKAKMPDHIITSLIEDFSRYDLSLASCPADEMGQAYEYLVGKFADDAGNTAQEFYTNRTVVTLMAEILQPKPNESIYDPTCGSGGMLVKCLDFLRQKGEPWQGVKVFGQEINSLTSSIARMNCYLNGVEDFSIANGDTLASPKFFEGSKLRKFDIVLANPPYSIKQWDRDSFINDKFGRNMWGAPIQARADYAFIQHIIASMDPKTGRSATLLPHGVLNREEDKEIRINHVKSDTIDTIIGLGRNLFYNSGLESFIFICSNCKPKNKKGKILFIEAEKYTHKEGKQAYLYEEDIQRIINAYNSEDDIPGFSKHVSVEEVLQNEGNLNIKSYVKAVDTEDAPSLHKTLDNLTNCQHQMSVEYNLLPFSQVSLPEVDFVSSTYADLSTWKKVKLSDVAEEYSVRIENPSQSEYDFYIGSDCIGQYDFRIHKRSDASTITSTQKGFKTGDYLLVRRSLYGSDFRERAPRADFDGVCSADILTIREKKDIIADGFLIYVLYQKSLWDFIVSNSNGGLTRRIKWKQLADYEFALPPYDVQLRKSEKLWSAYRLKESYKKLLVATDEMVKSQFIEMFGTLDEPKVEVKKLIDVVLGSGQYGSNTSATDYQEGTPRYIRITDINDDGSLNDDIKTAEVIDDKYRLVSGDIVFARTGATVGKTYLHEAGKAIYAGYLIKYQMNTELMKPLFMKAFTHSKTYYDWVINSQKVGAQPNISATQYDQMPVLVPSVYAQEAFLKIYQQADKSKFVGFKSQFIEMFKNLPVNGVVKDLTVGNIASVKKSYSKEDIINYIDISSIDNTTKTIVETSEHLVTKAPSRAQQCVQKGDILVSTVRPTNRNIAVIEEDTSHLVASTGFCILRPQEGYKEYLLSIVLSDTYTEKMCDKANGGLYPAVNNSDVLNYGIHIPDEDTAKKVSALYQQADKSKLTGHCLIWVLNKGISKLIN